MSADKAVVAAVDLGASTGRVALVDLPSMRLRVVHRFAHTPSVAGGALRWDWDGIVDGVREGLRRGSKEADLASIGVDAWGVDYGLLDRRGRLVAPPVSYRDGRTRGWRRTIDRLGAERVYGVTGVQMMAINTLCQLAVHDRAELAAARRLLMLPELLVHELTGVPAGERTSAGTTQLLDVRAMTWSADLAQDVGVEPSILPPVGPAGRACGSFLGVPVHLVGGHDTASAVAALPAPQPGSAFVSSGTWALVGVERDEPDTSSRALQANFSNELGACGGVRFLKNVMGLWMLEECRRTWEATSEDDLRTLLDAAAALPPADRLVDARDERFLAPADMEDEVRAAAGLMRSAGRADIVRCILDSLAVAVAEVVDELEGFLPARPAAVHVVGGGSRNGLLNRLIEEACEMPVVAGPAEATCLGNAIVQGVALGVFEDLQDGRRAVALSLSGER